jgi:putative aldouronate transport system substrate-binding protein
VLKVFKDKDPNGNGKADEIPFTPWFSVGNPALNSRAAFIRSFLIGAWGISTDWYQEKGVVKYGPLQPEFKEFLKTVAQWYKEGLIDPDFVSSDQKTVDAKVTGNQLGALSMNTGGGIGKYMPLLTAKDPKAKLVAAPYVALKKGDKPPFGHREFNYPGQGSVAITTANKHVTETVKWLDYGYSPEGHLLFNFGVQGVSYNMKDGYPTYTDAMFKDPQLAPAQVMSKYMRAAFNGPFVQDRRYMEQYSTLQEQKDSITIWMDAVNDKLMPPVTPTQDESKKFASVMNDINTRYDETFTKVLAGQLPLDAWDTFVKDLKTMGIDDAIKIQQAALERYNKRV